MEKSKKQKRVVSKKVWILHPKYHGSDDFILCHLQLASHYKKSGNYVRATITYPLGI